MQVIQSIKTQTYTKTDFERAIDAVDEIETMPVVAQRLLQLSSDPEFDMNCLQHLVQSDPVIAAKILRVASSPFYGSRPASNLRAALIRIGMRDLKKLVLASAMVGHMRNKFTDKLWRYSMQVAAVSEAIAHWVATRDLDDPFLCGLLHDFGSVVMNKAIGKDYRALIADPGAEGQREAEVEAYGFDHCDLGVMVANKWKLFPALEDVMQHHHDPLVVELLGLSDASQSAVYVVSLARLAVQACPDEQASTIEALCERLDLSREELDNCHEKGLKVFQEMYAALL